MTTTPTTEPFDAFEQRLAAALTAEAATVDPPADGLDRIQARVTHRRRARRATWLAAAAALVVIAGIVAVALRPTDQGSTPYVDTRPTVPADGPPLLAPVDPALGLGVADWQAGGAYNLMIRDNTPGPAGQAVLPSSATFAVHGGPDDSEPGPWDPIEVAGHAAELRQGPDTRPAIRWAVAPGWVAEVSGFGVGSDTTGQVEAQMRRIVEKVEPVDELLMQRLLDGVLGNGVDGLQYRLGLVGGGQTFVRSVVAVEVVSTITVDGRPTNTFQLRSSQILSRPFSLPAGERRTIRGQDAVLTAQTDLDGGRHRVLVWIEDGWEHRLFFTDAATLGEATALAGRLTLLDDGQWHDAHFPSTVPAGLASTFWVGLESDSDPTTATTVTSSGS